MSAVADGCIQFGVLGTLQMTVGGTLLRLGTPKQRAVLAMLVINRNRAVGNDTLIDAVWGQDPPAGARNTLHTYISNLRRLISSAGFDPGTILASVPPGYRLGVADDQCDCDRFLAERQAGLVAAAAMRFEEASRHLSTALAEWRGPVLDDLRDFGFVSEFAKAQIENNLIARTALAEAEIACGRAHSVILELETLAAEHPYRESIWAQLITAYYLAERQSDALAAYRRLKTTLAEDLGIDPGPKLCALHDQILRQLPLDVRTFARSSAEDTIASDSDAAGAWGDGSPTLRDAAGVLYSLASTKTRIGRSPDNDIVLSDATVSRHHAVIVADAGIFVITDLGSRNGVRVRGRRVLSGAVALDDGDCVRIGDCELTFEVNSAETVNR
jgi:SARP family transcriptional regulator, regulator of embCAB operon